MIVAAMIAATATFANAQSEKTVTTKKTVKTECCEKASQAKADCCKDKKACCKSKATVDATTSATTQTTNKAKKAKKAAKLKVAKKTSTK